MDNEDIRPDNCPPCPVCEGKLDEQPKEEKTGFFGKLFGMGKKAENKLADTQDKLIGNVKESANKATNNVKSIGKFAIAPLNKFLGQGENTQGQAQGQAQGEPQGEPQGQEQGQEQFGGRKNKNKNKKRTNKKKRTNNKKRTNKKNGSKKHLKKRTTKKRFIKRK